MGTSTSGLYHTNNHTNLFPANAQADSISKMLRKLIWPIIRGHLACVPFLATVSLGQMSNLASLEMGPLWTWKAAVISKCSFSQPKTHTALRHVPNVWKYGQLPCCPQALMIKSPAEAPAAVQTRCSFRAHLVLNKNSHRSYQLKS